LFVFWVLLIYMGKNLFITAAVFKRNTEEFYWDRVLVA
jgi:hypothetical protein